MLIGTVIGTVAGRIERKSLEYEFLEETSLLSVPAALSFAVLGGVELLGSDGIPAAFVAGLFFNCFANSSDEAAERKIQGTVLRLFTFPIFVSFGIVLPVDQWLELGCGGVVVAAGVLHLRRPP